MEKIKYAINLSITICDEEGSKTYILRKDYEGDSKKLSIDVLIDGWFIENNIDKTKLESFDAYVYKCNEKLPMC